MYSWLFDKHIHFFHEQFLNCSFKLIFFIYGHIIYFRSSQLCSGLHDESRCIELGRHCGCLRRWSIVWSKALLLRVINWKFHCLLWPWVTTCLHNTFLGFHAFNFDLFVVLHFTMNWHFYGLFENYFNEWFRHHHQEFMPISMMWRTIVNLGWNKENDSLCL